MNLFKMKEQQNSSYYENSPEHNESNTISHIMKNTYRLNSQEKLQEIKLAQLEPVMNRNKPREQLEPSYREVVQVLQLLEQRMSHRDIDKIIRILYYNLISTKDEQEPLQQNNKELRGWEDLMQAKEIEVPPISFKQYSVRPLVREKKFLRVGDESKFIQRQIVAKAFVYRQYGLQHLEAEIVESKSLIIIKRHRYTDLAYAVVTQGYRSLEHFLMNQCKRNIKTSDKFEMGALHKILCNCRILLKPEESMTFLKFVRIAYNLQSVSVTQQSAVKLYISLQKEIRARVGNRQLDRSKDKRQWTKYLNMKRRSEFSQEDFANFVTPAIEREVVDEYLKTRLVSKIKAYLVEKYPEHKNLFTLQSVRGIICKVVRITIKRVFYYCDKYKDQNLPKMLPIDSAYRCKLSKGPESLKIRIQLLKLWMTKQKKVIKKLPTVIHEINQFINLQESQRANYVIAKSKPNTSVVEKLDFNINVSRSKLTEGFKVSAKNEVVLKGTESNFQHYVNIQNGKNLHYYRKIGHNYHQTADNPDNIKIEDLDYNSDSSSNSDGEKSQNKQNSGDNDSSSGVQIKRCETSVEAGQEESDKTEMVIKAWLQKLDLNFFHFI